MITAEEARRRSKPVRAQLDADRRDRILKSIDGAISEAANRGCTSVDVDLSYLDTEYIKGKVIEAGYQVTCTHDGIMISW